MDREFLRAPKNPDAASTDIGRDRKKNSNSGIGRVECQ